MWFLNSPLFTVQESEAATSNAEIFPSYKVIRNNVTFWEKIYATYSINDAVIHDADDLSKIYDVIPLLDHKLPGASRLNTMTQQLAIRQYSSLLKKLSHQGPKTTDEIRIAALFPGKYGRKAMALAANNVRSQSGQKERFLAGVIRSKTYIDEMRQILRSHRLPEELAYLPHVESSFNARAYSKFGAAGMWQFTRATGKQYLRIDTTLDERLDPILATHAAAKYLKNAHSKLGNWPLALTAYNHGLSGMIRALDEQRSYPRIFSNYAKGHFKFASKNFYSEFLAAIKVAKRLEKTKIIRLIPGQSYKYLTLPGHLRIKNAIKYLNCSTATIKSYNPALRPPIFTDKKLLPKGYALRFPDTGKTTRLTVSLPLSAYKKKQKISLFHRVRKGDNVRAIARQYKISAKNLVTANDLDKKATIYIRQKLWIPRPAKIKDKTRNDIPWIYGQNKIKKKIANYGATPSIYAKNKKRRSAEKGYYFMPKNNPAAYIVSGTYIKNGRLYGTITVQPEESLSHYADWLGVSLGELLNLNRLKPGINLELNQRILLVFGRISPIHFEDIRVDFLREVEEDFFTAFAVANHKTYRVNPGDTLWGLCYNKFNIPIWLLRRYNPTVNLAKLKNKQKLIIPIVEAS